MMVNTQLLNHFFTCLLSLLLAIFGIGFTQASQKSSLESGEADFFSTPPVTLMPVSTESPPSPCDADCKVSQTPLLTSTNLSTSTSIIYYDYDQEIWHMDENGENQQFLTKCTPDEYCHVYTIFSQDGQRIIYTKNDRHNAGYRPNTIIVTTLDGSWSLALIDHPLVGWVDNIQDSFDGQYISYNTVRHFDRGEDALYSIHVPTGNRYLLATHHYPFAIWSPVEAKVVVRLPLADAMTDSPSGLYLMNGDGSEKALLITEYIVGGDWSPDGQSLAISVRGRWPDKVDRIMLLNVDSRVTNTLRVDGDYFYYAADGTPVLRTGDGYLTRSANYPKWSPDGQKLLYIGNIYRTKVHQAKTEWSVLFVYDLATDTHYRLAEIYSIYDPPLWSPDSQKILYKAADDNEWYIVSLVDGQSKPWPNSDFVLSVIRWGGSRY